MFPLGRAFGIDLFTGSMNVLLWLSYVVMLALYARAFGSYGATFFPNHGSPWIMHALISAAIIAPTGLNLLSADFIGRAEMWVVVSVAVETGYRLTGGRRLRLWGSGTTAAEFHAVKDEV